jgi:hypothetical protein
MGKLKLVFRNPREYRAPGKEDVFALSKAGRIWRRRFIMVGLDLKSDVARPLIVSMI